MSAKKRSWCAPCGFLAPDELVEHSAFLDKGSGVNVRDQLSTCQQFRKLFWDDMMGCIFISSLEGYSFPVQLIVGLFLQAGAIVLFVYFITTTYISVRQTTFISLDKSAGDCSEVPLSITGVYTLDNSGHWLGNSLFNPSAAYYSFSMSNFVKNTDEYKAIIASQVTAFASIGAIGKVSELADNLLYWTAWSQIVDDKNSTQRWQLSGDAKVVFDRQNYLGALGNQAADCTAASTVAYNPATGEFVLTYSHSSYLSKGSCYNIITPDALDYDSTANADTLSIRWDGASHIVARAINKQIITQANLVEVTSGVTEQVYLVDGVTYTRKYNVDSRYPKMDPVICFVPEVPTPTSNPTASPTTSTVAIILATQTVSGVTVASANTTSGRSLLQASIASVAVVPSSAVTISGVSAAVSLAGILDGHSSSYQLSSLRKSPDSRELASAGIIVRYTLRVINGDYSALTARIQSSVTSGTFTAALKATNSPIFSDASVTILPSIVNESPTATPTVSPTPSPSRSTGTDGSPSPTKKLSSSPTATGTSSPPSSPSPPSMQSSSSSSSPPTMRSSSSSSSSLPSMQSSLSSSSSPSMQSSSSSPPSTLSSLSSSSPPSMQSSSSSSSSLPSMLSSSSSPSSSPPPMQSSSSSSSPPSMQSSSSSSSSPTMLSSSSSSSSPPSMQSSLSSSSPPSMQSSSSSSSSPTMQSSSSSPSLSSSSPPSMQSSLSSSSPPTMQSSSSPSSLTQSSSLPSVAATSPPSLHRSHSPSIPDTSSPSLQPSSPSPSITDTSSPSLQPSSPSPSITDTSSPSLQPSSPSPSITDTSSPSLQPSSPSPSITDTSSPSLQSSSSSPSITDTSSPSLQPSSPSPSITDTSSPSLQPSSLPSVAATTPPSLHGSHSPSLAPSASPSRAPTINVPPSRSPSAASSLSPKPSSSLAPSASPSSAASSTHVPTMAASASGVPSAHSASPTLAARKITEEGEFNHQSLHAFSESKRKLSTTHKTFCVVKINGVLGYPFYMHYGPAGTGKYNQFEPQRCVCGEASGSTSRCSQFDLISGFVLFPGTDMKSIIEFDLAVEDINQAAYNASFASINLANGQADSNKAVADAAGGATLTAFSRLLDTTWRTTAYSFCTHGCLGILIVNSFDTYNTAVNGAFHQIVNGSCTDAVTIPQNSWALAAANPPTSLTAGYYKCQYTMGDCVINAIGVGSGTASSIIPFMIIIVVWLCTRTCLVKKKLIKDVYEANERDRALCHLITHLLTLRDTRDKDTDASDTPRDENFLQDLLSGANMSPYVKNPVVKLDDIRSS